VADVQVTEQQALGTRAERSWTRSYALRLAITDLVVVVWAVVGAQLLRFGVSAEDEARVGQAGALTLNYTVISAVLIVAWMVVLAIFRTRDNRVVGSGAVEYRLVIQSTLWLFGLGAIVLFLFKVDIARAYVLIALPLGLIVLVLSRWLWRQWLNSRRRTGAFSYRVVLVGTLDAVIPLARDLMRTTTAGYRVIAAVVPGASGEMARLPGTAIPVTSDIDAIPSLMSALNADTLVIASTDRLPAGKVRELSWALDPGRQHLVMAPNLTDVGGPRIHMRPVAGLPLMHVETPRFVGPQLFLKRGFDILATTVLIVALSPLLITATLMVRFGSPGPVFFRQERIGFQGRPFRMVKFRSMVADAEDQLPVLLEQHRDAGNEVLFKLQDDPRVTKSGRWMRRYSIDELPQLFNVLAGSMSLVGPRPPLAREVDAYEAHVHRKFLVKPGVTGLWQVSGRSSLSWEESVRLDLYYVENWSITGDLSILWRTLRAVVRREGAF
jgi:exopolysaccharide biosynthesis polyprenyl glycosylphosphotransferase